MKKYDKYSEVLRNQFRNIEWLEHTGISEEELKSGCDKIMANSDNLPVCIVKAKLFEYILANGRLAITKDDIFQEKVFEGHFSGGIISTYR
ncbi:MAG: hypothetical protein IKK13_01970 [Clostridia bacterium]|nr:hypothetical protein [Clostridia bacterium]